MMFQKSLTENLDETLFDLLLLSSVSKSTYKRMELLPVEKDLEPQEFVPKNMLRNRVANYFTIIKQNMYKLIDQNLKKTFVELFNAPTIPKNIMSHTTLMMKLLNIIPKDLRIYIREGVIFNKMKIIKSLWRKSCKENLNNTNMYKTSSLTSLERYTQLFIHLPLIIKVISKCGEKVGIPLNNEHVMSIFEKYLGKGPALVMISAMETIFQ